MYACSFVDVAEQRYQMESILLAFVIYSGCQGTLPSYLTDNNRLLSAASIILKVLNKS